MRISDATPLHRPDGPQPPTDRVNSPEEAVRKFEEVLARQFVQVMTKDLFKNNMAGEEGPAWMSGHADTQRDILTDALAQHLVDQGTLGLSELLLKKWNLNGSLNAENTTPSPSTPEQP
jgi:Rod binding domain-containing protein